MLGNMPGWHWGTERVDEFSTSDLRVISSNFKSKFWTALSRAISKARNSLVSFLLVGPSAVFLLCVLLIVMVVMLFNIVVT